MPRRLVRITLAFALAGVLIPVCLMLMYGAAYSYAGPQPQARFQRVSVFLWPAGAALAGNDGSVLPMRHAAATLVTVVENAVLYTMLGLVVGCVAHLLWPDPAKFDPNASEEELEREKEKVLTATKGQ